MDNNIERNLGEQPLLKIMQENKINPRDLVDASLEQLTFKMVSRAVKGRRLTTHAQYKILNALNKVTQRNYSKSELFNY